MLWRCGRSKSFTKSRREQNKPPMIPYSHPIGCPFHPSRQPRGTSRADGERWAIPLLRCTRRSPSRCSARESGRPLVSSVPRHYHEAHESRPSSGDLLSNLSPEKLLEAAHLHARSIHVPKHRRLSSPVPMDCMLLVCLSVCLTGLVNLSCWRASFIQSSWKVKQHGISPVGTGHIRSLRMHRRAPCALAIPGLRQLERTQDAAGLSRRPRLLLLSFPRSPLASLSSAPRFGASSPCVQGQGSLQFSLPRVRGDHTPACLPARPHWRPLCTAPPRQRAIKSRKDAAATGTGGSCR
jgi:hypothetical protein